jgi:protein-tyrosine-phosphatase
MNMRSIVQYLKGSAHRKLIGAGIVLVGLSVASTPLLAAESSAVAPNTVIFVCKYGSMKSQMAAAYFNRVAKERGLQLTAISRAFAPDKVIPDMIRENMAKEGLAPTNETITSLKPEEAVGAASVVSFDELPDENIGKTKYIHWANSPLSKKDYWGAMDFIKKHVDEQVAQIASKPTTVGSR